MRFFSEPSARLLASVVSLSVVAVGSTFLLTGCGSGSGNASLPSGTVGGTNGGSNGGSNGGGNTSSFAGRSYKAQNITLTGGRTGTLTMQVSSNNVLTGSLVLAAPADTVPLTGTFTPATGAYRLTGALTRAAVSKAAGDPVVVSGTLPAPPATVGGSVSLTVGGQTLTLTFGASVTPVPNPTAPAPNPTAPAPNPSPGGGSGTLGEYYSAFVSNNNDTFTYKFTTADTLAPDPNNESSTNTNQSTIHGGVLFGAAFAGQKTTVTINLPLSGAKTVTRQEQLNPMNNTVIGYDYFTEDASGRTDYGDDSVFNTVVLSSTRYDNGERIPFSLSPGQNYSQTFTVFETQFDYTGAQTSQYSYVQQDTITFVGVETVTVAGGTYSKVAHLRGQVSYTVPPNTSSNPGGVPEPTTETSDFYLSKYVGLLQLDNRTVTQNMTGRVDATGDPFTYTDTADYHSELLSATVGGTNYPPGRSVKAPSAGSGIAMKGHFFPHFRH